MQSIDMKGYWNLSHFIAVPFESVDKPLLHPLAFLRFCVRSAFVPLCLCASVSAFAQTGIPKAGGIDSIGVNIHFTAPKPGEMEQIAAAGFKWVRMDFFWAGIERVRGVYDFSAYDGLLRHLDQFKIRPIFILDYGNALYEKGSPKSPEARAGFAKFAAAAVTHFKGRGVLWEMWNEPNGGFWTPRANVDEYIALALDTGKAIKAAQPDEIYIGPATSGMDFAFIEKCFQAGLLKYWDAVSFHPYRDSPPETAIPDFNHIKALTAQYAPNGKQIPILSGEWGYSELYPGLSLDLQSKYISREFLTDISNELIVSIWYDWHDDGTDPKETEHHFGTVYQDYKPKPTYTAAKTLSSALAGLHFNKRLALSNPNDYCLLFSQGDEVCLAAWTTDKYPHAVTLPASAGPFDRISSSGEVSEAAAESAGIHIELSGAPVYLRPKSANRLLSIASEWPTVHPSILCDDKEEAADALLPLFSSILLDGHVVEGAKVTVATDAGPLVPTRWILSRGMVKFAGFLSLNWEPRNAEGMRFVATLELPGSAAVSQETQIYPKHPVILTVAPSRGGKLAVTIDNPTGAKISGRVVLKGDGDVSTAALELEAGSKRASVLLPAPASINGKYRVQLTFEEQALGGQQWEKTLTSPAVEYQSYETFDKYDADKTPPASDFTVEPDGDPKVKSLLSLLVERAPSGLPGEPRKALHVDYNFDPGWKFLRVAPHGAKHAPLAGEPTALGMWVHGDGTNNILNMRYTDSTGQTFQTSAGAIDWKDWRFVQFSLTADHASHWGGANDGVIHYPIAFDTVALVDSHDRQGGNGRIWIADLTIIQRVDGRR